MKRRNIMAIHGQHTLLPTLLLLVSLLAACAAIESVRTDAAVSASAHVAAVEPFSVVMHCAENPLPTVIWVHVHENETTAWQAARWAVARQGAGCVIGLQHGSGRLVHWPLAGYRLIFDPNRMFTPAGRTATLRRHHAHDALGENHLARLADGLVCQYLQHRALWVAVHNNHVGGISVYSYAPGGALAEDALQVVINDAHSKDDFFLVTTKRAFDFLVARGFNVVWQNHTTVRDDGSLSVYAAQQGVDYINVEAAYGHLTQQQTMLAAVWDYIHHAKLTDASQLASPLPQCGS